MIGIVGAGTIVTAAHLPAYAKLNLPVVSLYDVDARRAAAAAKQWELDQPNTLDELILDDRVQIVDIAVPPGAQPDIAKMALRAGKHVLAQKPLARTSDLAVEMVALAEESNRHLVVNQQMRWTPVARAIRKGIEDDSLGRLEMLTFDCDISILGPELGASWGATEPRGMVALNSIHLLDTARYFMGEPVSVTAVFRREARLGMAGETAAIIALDFAEGAKVWILDCWNLIADHRAAFQAVGSNGAFRGHFGLWTNYPTGAADAIEFTPRDGKGEWQTVPVTERWIPDAFVGPIGELVAAIQGGPTPSTAGSDNLKTLKLVDAVYESAATGQRIDLTP